MKVQSQSYALEQYQVNNHTRVQVGKSGNTLPADGVDNSLSAKNKFDFTNMTIKELSEASKALYGDGVLTLGQHAVLSSKYFIAKHGIDQVDGVISQKSVSNAENKKINVIAMEKQRLREASQSGSSRAEIEFTRKLINALESYQFGGGGKFYVRA